MMKRNEAKVSDVLAMFGKDKQGILEAIGAKEVVISSHGEVLSVNGNKLTTGPKKRSGRGKRASDGDREILLDAIAQCLRTSAAFVGKVHSVESKSEMVIRMADADYTVAVTAHAKAEFADREEGFIAERVAPRTAKNTVNHSAAIAGFIVEQVKDEFNKSSVRFGNENLELKNENQNLVTLLCQNGNQIRFELKDKEYSFKVTKKKDRVVTAV